MKQLDMILCVVAVVVGIVGSYIVWSMKKPAEGVPGARTINTTPAQLPAPVIAYTPGLPGATGGAGGGMGKGRKAGFVG
jgi:hypothetical protein